MWSSIFVNWCPVPAGITKNVSGRQLVRLRVLDVVRVGPGAVQELHGVVGGRDRSRTSCQIEGQLLRR